MTRFTKTYVLCGSSVIFLWKSFEASASFVSKATTAGFCEGIRLGNKADCSFTWVVFVLVELLVIFT